MAAFINTNISSLNAQRNLNSSQGALATSLQRLSTGLRINSAKDDAAGLAISERMTSQIRGADQAARNANDGISLAQTAEGDLTQIGNNLQRMRELAVQASNATNSASDRAALNGEVQALAAEIDRVAANSSFNGVNLLDGSFSSQSFQVGANATANDRITIDAIGSARTSALGGVGTSYAATTTSGKITGALAAGDLTLNGFQVGASSIGSAPGQSAASAFSVAKAINAISANSGVTATANVNTVTGAAASSGAIAANTFSINGINVGEIAAGGSAAGQGANVAAAINKVSTQTGVTASANATTGAITLTATDGRDINLALNGTAASPADAATAKAAFLANTGLVADKASAAVSGTAIANSATFTPAFSAAGGTIAAGSLKANGIDVGAVTLATEAYNAVTNGTATTAGDTISITGKAGTLAAGELMINGAKTTAAFTFTGNAATDAAAFADYVNTQGGLTAATTGLAASGTSVTTGSSGVITFTLSGVAADQATATANRERVAGTNGSGTGGFIDFGGSGVLGRQASGGAAYNGQQLAAAINTALSSAPGGAAVNGSVAVTTATTGEITTTKGSGSMLIEMGGTATDAATALTNRTTLATQTGLSAAQLGLQAAGTNTTNHGTISLSSTSANGIVWGGAKATSAGLAASGTQTATVASAVTSIASINVLTASNATEALKAIDGALETVNTSRASLGAYQNRFASVVSSLQTTSENLSASRSRIQDTDFAKETASLTRGQILQQAGTAMLAQANSLPNGVLALLRG